MIRLLHNFFFNKTPHGTWFTHTIKENTKYVVSLESDEENDTTKIFDCYSIVMINGER